MNKIEKIGRPAAFMPREKVAQRQREFRSAWMRAAQKSGMEHFIITQVDGAKVSRNVTARGLKPLLSGEKYLGLYKLFLEEAGAGRFWLEDAKVPEKFIAGTERGRFEIRYAGSGEKEGWHSDQVIPSGLVDVLLLAGTPELAAEFVKACIGNPHHPQDEALFRDLMSLVVSFTPEYPEVMSGIISASRGTNGGTEPLVGCIPTEKTLEIMGRIREDSEKERKWSREELAILAVSYLNSMVNRITRQARPADGAGLAEVSDEQRESWLAETGDVQEAERAIRDSFPPEEIGTKTSR